MPGAPRKSKFPELPTRMARRSRWTTSSRQGMVSRLWELRVGLIKAEQVVTQPRISEMEPILSLRRIKWCRSGLLGRTILDPRGIVALRSKASRLRGVGLTLRFRIWKLWQCLQLISKTRPLLVRWEQLIREMAEILRGPLQWIFRQHHPNLYYRVQKMFTLNNNSAIKYRTVMTALQMTSLTKLIKKALASSKLIKMNHKCHFRLPSLLLWTKWRRPWIMRTFRRGSIN